MKHVTRNMRQKNMRSQRTKMLHAPCYVLPILCPVPQVVVHDNERAHRIDDRHRARKNARVVTPRRFELGQLILRRHRILLLPDGRYGLEPA